MLIGGPTGALIVIVYGIVEKYGIDGLIISSVMAGFILILFGLLKLGSLLKYFPHSLVVGFTSGIAVVIFSTQIRDAFGLEIDKVPSDFIDKWRLFYAHLDHINYHALAITSITIFIILIFTKLKTKIPGSFIAIIFITVTVQVLHLPVTTIESFFGDIPAKFDLVIPAFELDKFSVYIAPAITIAILGAIESLLSAVVSDGMIGGNHRSNTELIAQGVANIVTPFFEGIPSYRSNSKNCHQCEKWRQDTNFGYGSCNYLIINYAVFRSMGKTNSHVLSGRRSNYCCL